MTGFTCFTSAETGASQDFGKNIDLIRCKLQLSKGHAAAMHTRVWWFGATFVAACAFADNIEAYRCETNQVAPSTIS